MPSLKRKSVPRISTIALIATVVIAALIMILYFAMLGTWTWAKYKLGGFDEESRRQALEDYWSKTSVGGYQIDLLIETNMRPQWTPGGRRIVFSTLNVEVTSDVKFIQRHLGDIFFVDTDGSGVTVMNYPDTGVTDPDISSDGMRMVYLATESETMPSGLRGRPTIEIETASLDGVDRRRLTADEDYEAMPVWSPDGSRIAYVNNGPIDERNLPESFWQDDNSQRTGIYTVAPDGTDRRAVALYNSENWGDDWYSAGVYRGRLFRYGPVWSPDGSKLAFTLSTLGDLSSSETLFRSRSELYIVEADGSEWRLLFAGGIVSRSDHRNLIFGAPEWSPDGSRLAFLYRVIEDREVVGAKLLLVNADGTGLRELASNLEVGDDKATLDWSPDGKEILVSSSSSYLKDWELGSKPVYAVKVDADTPDVRAISLGSGAVWSPDGSRIAKWFDTFDPASEDEFRPERLRLLATMGRDGSDVRVLGRMSDRFELSDEGRPTLAEWLSVCESREVVPMPERNAGLVEDCKTLLTVRETFAYEPDELTERYEPRPILPEQAASLNWNGDTPITEWGGVSVDGEPARVVELELGSVYGVLRPELGRLSELQTLVVDSPWMYGPIPAELGELKKLETLVVDSPQMHGPIPSELGKLKSVSLHRDIVERSECVPESVAAVFEFGSSWDDFIETSYAVAWLRKRLCEE